MARPTLSIVLVRPLVAALSRSQNALAAFYAATELMPQMLADDEARITPAQHRIAWAETLRLTGDPMLPLTIAENMPLGAFGIVEYVCRSAPTLRDALRQWVRYLGILDNAVELAFVEHGAYGMMRVVSEREAPIPAAHELCFACVVARMRPMVHDPRGLVGVCFTHLVSGAAHARYRAFFACDVVFGAPRTELVFEKQMLDAPLATADANLLAVLLTAAEAQHRRTPTHPPLTDQVRRALRTALSHDDAQLDVVARRLGITGRSLQRRLKDEGTVFQAVRDKMRRDLADRYLGEQMSFSEISFLLGFSEPSAFFRAFKRWNGLTPFERRASLALAARVEA